MTAVFCEAESLSQSPPDASASDKLELHNTDEPSELLPAAKHRERSHLLHPLPHSWPSEPSQAHGDVGSSAGGEVLHLQVMLH